MNRPRYLFTGCLILQAIVLAAMTPFVSPDEALVLAKACATGLGGAAVMGLLETLS